MKLSVMPNPNAGTFTIAGTFMDQPVRVDITNVLGQKVYSADLNPVKGSLNNEIRLSSELKSGVYFLRVSSEQQKELMRIMILK